MLEAGGITLDSGPARRWSGATGRPDRARVHDAGDVHAPRRPGASAASSCSPTSGATTTTRARTWSRSTSATCAASSARTRSRPCAAWATGCPTERAHSSAARRPACRRPARDPASSSTRSGRSPGSGSRQAAIAPRGARPPRRLPPAGARGARAAGNAAARPRCRCRSTPSATLPGVAIVVEGRLAGGHLEQDRADPPDVGRGPRFPPRACSGDMYCQVPTPAGSFPGRAGEAEVDELRATGLRDHVRRLQVEVQEACGAGTETAEPRWRPSCPRSAGSAAPPPRSGRRASPASVSMMITALGSAIIS